MGAVAVSRTDNMFEDPTSDGVGLDAIAQMAAEKARPKLAQLGASRTQQGALVEAMRFVLLDELPRAEMALSREGFSPAFIQQVLPRLSSGLRSSD